MKPKTSRLILNEIRMLYNQIKQTIKTPSMLLFYSITIFGIFFISIVIVSFLSFAPITSQLGLLLENTIERGILFAALGIVSSAAILSGYFGLGPASMITTDDENILLPAPVKPYQLFLSRYIRRVIRKAVFALLGLVAILPLLSSAELVFFQTLFFLICTIIFLESNYLLGVLSSFLKLRFNKITKRPIRHLIIVPFILIVIVLILPDFTSSFNAAAILPSNAFGFIITEVSGVFSLGIGYGLGFIYQIISFTVCLLLATNIASYEYYELSSVIKEKESTELNLSGIIRGEVDFSNSRFNDPSVWIMLKDFWSRLRSPFQIWKYLYAFTGGVFVVYLNLFHPPWFRSIEVPNSLQFAIVPAFILMMILLVQMSSITSMSSFVDEKENVYLLKASPFKTKDIVLAKYLLSLLEVSLAIVPAAGLIIYILRIEGYLALITLVAPLTILFSASGVAVGAYVPVITNDPKQLPIPLAFSYPVINLALGGGMILLVATFAKSPLVLILLPLYSIGLTFFFLFLALKSINSYK
ncbi:hypothetical protein EU527_02330 [Candidatus Thorarchaeota archaeon]|nr:MAG: hypothetical protein EU527_02330 [Candidatus Thorarchaeota archaeon]